jgi:hypothetical protein
MSEHPLTFEQIQTMRAAIDMVVSCLGPHVSRRAEAISLIVPRAGNDGHSAARLANIALEKMGVAISVSEGEAQARKGG